MLLSIVFGMTGFSLLISAFARTREQIIPLGLTVIMIVCAIGGCWWPLYQEPLWLQQMAHVAVTAWAMDGIHDLILRERSLGDVLPIMAALVAYGGICLAAGIRLYDFGD
jgi:ABC-2 type transport system permease protein